MPHVVSSKRSSSGTSDLAAEAKSVNDYVSSLETRWELSNTMKMVIPNRATATMSEAIYSTTTWKFVANDTIHNDTSVFPNVIIEGLPIKRYPEYMSFMLTATIVEAVLERPALAKFVESSHFLRLATIAVAVRCGVWASFGLLPEAAIKVPASVVAYDTKRSRLWKMPRNFGTSAAEWLNVKALIVGRLKGEEEIMAQLCIVAPMLCLMASSWHSRRGEVYAEPYVEQSVSACIKSRLSRDAYASLHLDQEVSWEMARDATVLGLPKSAVRSWADDALVAVGAQKRIATTKRDLERFAKRETKLREGAVSSTSHSVYAAAVDDDNDMEDPTADEWRHVMSTRDNNAREDDDITLPTMYDAMPSRPATPEAMTLPDVPSRSTTPTQAMTSQEAMAIRAAVATAHQGGERAASEIMGATDDDTVKW